MNKLLLPAAAVVAAISLAGCADTAGPTAAPEAAPSPTAPATEPSAQSASEQERTERGALPKQYGEEAGLGTPDNPILTFTVGQPRPAECQQFAQPPENGRFLALPISVQTFDDPDNSLPLVTFGAGWEHVAASGLSTQADTMAAVSCDYDLPDMLRPNRTYEFDVIVDVPEGSGVLVLPGPAGDGGWEWPLQG